MATVELEGVSKAYGAHRAVHELSLAVDSGESVALLGPSGCGKTTTLNMIAGFLEPDAGHIRIDGRAVDGVPPYRRNIGMVFQHYALFPHLTVADNLAFGLRMRKAGTAEIVCLPFFIASATCFTWFGPSVKIATASMFLSSTNSSSEL